MTNTKTKGRECWLSSVIDEQGDSNWLVGKPYENSEKENVEDVRVIEAAPTLARIAELEEEVRRLKEYECKYNQLRK